MGESSPSHNGSGSQGTDILAEMHRLTGVEVTPSVIDVIASTPDGLESFWGAVAPAFRSDRVQSTANKLQNAATAVARDAIQLPDHLAWLTDQGFTREDSRQIRHDVETSCRIEAVNAILALLAEKWLCREALLGNTSFVPPMLPESLGSLLKAWPAYAAKASADLACISDECRLSELVSGIRGKAEALSSSIPTASQATCSEAEIARLTSLIEECLTASCNTLLASCALRNGFIEAESAARRRQSES